MPTKTQKTWVTPLFLVFIFVLSRFLYLFFLNPYYFAQFHYEELFRGLISLEFWKGLSFPFIDYRPDDYSGAWLFIGFLGSLFFRILEPSVFALKMVAFTFSGLAFYFWAKTIKRLFGETALLYFSAFFIFAPISFMNYSLTSMGDFTETILFSGIALFLYTQKSKTKTSQLLLGITLGLGIWFNYFVSLTFLSILIAWILKEKISILKASNLFVPLGLAVGFSPWLLIHYFYPTQPFSVHGSPLWSHFQWAYLIRGFTNYRNFIGFDLLESFGPPFWGANITFKKIGMIVYSLIFFTPIIIACGIKKVRFLKNKAVFLIYVCTFLLILQLSDFREIRFFIPFHPFLFLFSACALTNMEETWEKHRLKIRVGFLTLIFSSWLAFNGPFLSLKHSGTAFKAKGYSYQFIDAHVCKELSKCIKRHASITKDLSPEDSHAFSAALALQALDTLQLKYPAKEIKSLNIPTSFDRYFYYFAGEKILEIKKTIDGSIRTISSLSLTDTQLKAMTLGILENAGNNEVRDLEDFEKSIQPSLEEPYWRSRGEAWATKIYGRNKTLTALNQLPDIPKTSRYHFIQGVGKFLYHEWSNRPFNPSYPPEEITLAFDKTDHTPLFEGVGIAWAERELDWRIADFHWYWTEFAAKLSLQNQSAILQSRKNFHLKNQA